MTPVNPAVVAERAATVRARLDAAGGADVRIVAVTKTFGPSAVDAAVAAGLDDVGENYAQEAAAKLSEITSAPTVHFIGRLQRNKVRLLAPHVDVWQTVDRPELATEIAKRVPGAKVMIQVDISGEESKGGCSPGTTEDLVVHATDAGLNVIGLMGVALLAEPQALLMDEAFSALDPELRHAFGLFVRDQIRDRQIPALLVSHDPADTLIADAAPIRLAS